ncbi:L-lactate permease [Deinococcus proteolyticus MRP]|uniref:L-lactate permease n=1 Tax=Deinococcus proteolyticus (strain ATCC 35074 / DSM 20540 / JCM 6276 / NBRC 101906 / NCIMB 13154 / VKM Ac-1939 / CCM 2703 / MRP) TaxID=693977 RepID=F0RL86_DEIPM|nr:L-lactate permease [Deinococcus proteolyticus]ADY26878.1 L-lactate permease [Deinococcus proteolyticus MRP]
MTALLALLPILSVFVLLPVLRRPAVQAMTLSLLLTVALALLHWQVSLPAVLASLAQGVLVALSILYIVLGAMALFSVLQVSGAVEVMQRSFMGLTSDRRIQVILVTWLFGAFIEGAAGFGTPAAIAAPLLAALGFPALAAAALPLIGNSTPVPFAAAGTPLLIGMRQGLSEGGSVSAALVPAVTAGGGMDAFLGQVGVQLTALDLLVGSLLPLVLAALMTRTFGARRSWREGLEVWPFALFAGLAYTVPAWAAAALTGPEFPGIVGGLAGLLLCVVAVRRGFLQPARPWDFAPRESWPPEWTGQPLPPLPPRCTPPLPTWQAWGPYLAVGALLVLTRLDALPLRGWLAAPQLGFSDLLGTGISQSLQPLYLPGFVFLVVTVCTALGYRLSPGQLRAAAQRTAHSLTGTALTLLTALPLVFVFINSGPEFSASGLPSMPLALAAAAAGLLGPLYPLAAPVVGALGSFVAGNATLSNVMFSLLQGSVAAQLGTSPQLLLALQASGAAAGNIICVAKVVAAAAVVGLSGREGQLMRLALPPVLYLLGAAGLLGLLLSWR